MFGDEGLVQPAAGQVQAIGQPVHRAQLGGGAGGQAVMGRACKRHVLDAQALHQLALVRCIAVLVDHEDVGPQPPQLRLEVQIARSAGDEGFMDAGDGTETATTGCTMSPPPPVSTDGSLLWVQYLARLVAASMSDHV